MPFYTLFPSPRASAALADLQRKFESARTSLVRIRNERLRLARNGWRPHAPTETKLIRSAEWQMRRAGESLPPALEFNLDSRFVPTVSAYVALAESLENARGKGESTRVFLRGLEIDEPRYLIGGKAVSAAFFDLVLTLSRNPDSILVLPRVDGYQEARFWSEVGRSLEESLGLGLGRIRFEVSIESQGGIVEAEEILFELKDSLVGIVYDARLDRFDSLLLESGTPRLPREDPSVDPWAGPEIASRIENLEVLARKRGVRFERRYPKTASESTLLTLDSLHQKVVSSFWFLKEWFDGNVEADGKDWVDFELSRALLWTAIHSGFLREENYDAWRESLGKQPFEAASAESAALKTLDPLVRTAVFSDSAKALAFSVLLDREKTRSVTPARLA
jgi:hypothetical protein